MAVPYPLQIGGITLQDMNAPSVLADFGSEQKIALFEFVGGVMTAQLLGRFPKAITFSQVILGSQALTLSRQIDQLTAATQALPLTWAGWSWTGIIKDVKIEPMDDGQIRYTIIYQPFAPQNPQATGDVFDPQDLFSGASQLAQTQTTSPTSGFTFPATITGGMSSLQSAASQALSSNQNNLANIPASTVQQLQSQISSLQQLLQPLMQGTAPQAASAAADLNNTLQQMSNALGFPQSPVTQVSVQNPDLAQLASVYYGDPSLAGVIAVANNLFDWAPTGTYTLTIPQNPNTSLPQPATLL